jgi:hypothetical protein
MRKVYIIMFAVGAFVLALALLFQVRMNRFELAGPLLLMGIAARGIWSDFQRAERMSEIYTHQRLGTGKPSGHYHEL